jgi:hypothetical protein
LDETTRYELFFFFLDILINMFNVQKEKRRFSSMQRKKNHTKTPFFKVRASKINSSKFFSLKKNFVVHTNKHVEHPQKFPRGASLPFFSFFFWERAGGRAGVSFSPVRRTGAGHHPGAGTKARFFHGCNRAHATRGRD